MPSSRVLLLAGFCGGVVLLQQQAALPPLPLLVVAVGAALVLVGTRVLHRSTAASARAAAAHALVVSGEGGPRARRLWPAVAIVAGALIVGFGYAAWRAEIRLADALPASWEGEDIEIVGVVDGLPRTGATAVRFAVTVERVVTAGAVVPERISLAWYARATPSSENDADVAATTPASSLPRVRAGERWSLTVRLVRPHGSVNPGGFDLEAWFLDRNIRATGYVRPEADNARVDAFAGRAIDYVQQARERIRERIFATLPDSPNAGLLAALAVGDQGAIPEAQWAIFNRTGVSHLVAISGLHVTAFAVCCGGLAFHLLRLWSALTARCAARKLALVAGLFTSAGYVALAGAEVPALRTLAMLATSVAGLWLVRPGSGWLIWLWSLAVVVAADPFAPLTAGFWLSYGAVGTLIYALGSRLESRPQGGWRRLPSVLAGAARTQWAATIGLVPATLALFGQVSLVSPIANAAAIPTITFAVVPLALAGVALPIDLPWTVADSLLGPLLAFLGALSRLPAAAWQQHAPLPWTMAAGIVGVLLLFSPRGVPGRLLGVVWLAPLVLVVPPSPRVGEAVVTALDVGQGLAVAIRTHCHALLYDTGPRYSDVADAGGRIVAPYLRAAGTPRLAGLIVSHHDDDHAGGALSLLSTVPVAWLSSSLPGDSPIVQRQRSQGRAFRCEAGQQWTWDGVLFTVLHPGPAAYEDETRKSNDLSCVLAIATRHGRVLVAGDVEARSEYELLARDAATLRSDVLIVPHHGSRTSSTAAFIEAVAPRLAIFTAGYRNRFGHPRPDVVERYRQRGIDIARTDRDGAVIVRLGEAGVGVERYRISDGRYWHRE